MPINVIYLVYAVAALAFIGIRDITTKSLSLLMPADIEPGMLTMTMILVKIKQLDKRKLTREEKPNANKEEDGKSTINI